MAELPGDDRAAAGMDVLVRVGAGGIAGEANLIAGGVAGVVVVEAADDGPLLHDPAGHRQQVAQEDAGHLARRNAELAAILDRGVWLGVPHVDVAGTAAHPQDDDRRFAPGGGGDDRSRLLTQKFAKAESGAAEDTGFQETPAIRRELPARIGTTRVSAP